MRYIHNAKLTVFLKPEEYDSDIGIIDIVKSRFKKLLPIDFEKERVSIKEENVDSFENRKIKILSLDISKESHTNVFIKILKQLMGPEQCKTLLEQRWSRLDEELFFYIRFDKEKALQNEFILTDGGDCIHIKLHLAAFPKNRETALKVVSEMLK